MLVAWHSAISIASHSKKSVPVRIMARREFSDINEQNNDVHLQETVNVMPRQN